MYEKFRLFFIAWCFFLPNLKLRPLVSFARSFKLEESIGSTGQEQQQRAGAVAATGKLS
jgi:hypothetical protein